MSKTALILLAAGAEEMELVITADVLRRAGVKVTIAGLNGVDQVKCSRGIVISPDTSFEASKKENYDAIILPGGLNGSRALARSTIVGEFLQQQEREGRIIAAICAAPIILSAYDICMGKKLTSFPVLKEMLEDKYNYIVDQKVVHDGNLITSRGPGTSFDFSLKIAEVLMGADKIKEIAEDLQLD